MECERPPAFRILAQLVGQLVDNRYYVFTRDSVTLPEGSLTLRDYTRRVASNKHLAGARICFGCCGTSSHVAYNARIFRGIVNPTALVDNQRNSSLRNARTRVLGAELGIVRIKQPPRCLHRRDCEAALPSAMHLLQQYEPALSRIRRARRRLSAATAVAAHVAPPHAIPRRLNARHAGIRSDLR